MLKKLSMLKRKFNKYNLPTVFVSINILVFWFGEDHTYTVWQIILTSEPVRVATDHFMDCPVIVQAKTNRLVSKLYNALMMMNTELMMTHSNIVLSLVFSSHVISLTNESTILLWHIILNYFFYKVYLCRVLNQRFF